jgi:thioredoxin reductase (NADPH)
MQENTYDLIIIGAGPAGLTAAIYGARSGMKVLVLERMMPGGYMAVTDYIENYPGFPEGIRGLDLAEKMKQQALKFGVEIIGSDVTSLSKQEHVVVSTGGKEYKARTVIVASGTTPKALGIPGEDALRGRGVSYCATCDGPLFRDKEIAVIGCGNSGIQEGHYLLNFVKRVTFVEFLPNITADRILQDRFKDEKRAGFFLNHACIRIIGDKMVESITVKDRKTDEEKTINVQGVFVYIGHNPSSQFLKHGVELDSKGFIKTSEKLETSMPGVYAAGDIRSKQIRQVITACAEGAEAAIHAYHYIESMKK